MVEVIILNWALHKRAYSLDAIYYMLDFVLAAEEGTKCA